MTTSTFLAEIYGEILNKCTKDDNSWKGYWIDIVRLGASMFDEHISKDSVEVFKSFIKDGQLLSARTFLLSVTDRRFDKGLISYEEVLESYRLLAFTKEEALALRRSEYLLVGMPSGAIVIGSYSDINSAWDMRIGWS